MVTEVEVVSVPGHGHQLWLSRSQKDDEKCKMCEKEILSSLLYSCTKCEFFICKSCAELPLHFNHPFHPQHTLVLCQKNILGCNVCGLLESGYGYGYECTQCEFSLHLKCASLKPTTKKNISVESDHQHPLIVCDNPNGYVYKCFRCDAIIEDDVYLCLDCHNMLDQWCAVRPREITHPFHLKHSLKLYTEYAPRCNLCSMVFYSYTAVYCCSSCNFTIDVHCATLFPAAKDSSPDQIHDGKIEIQPKTHPHSLVLCSTNFKNFAIPCYGCGLRFKGSIYICLQCGILLHKVCADLPREISHPFHTEHYLNLFENSPNMQVHSSSYCRVCDNGSGEFVYICRHCDVVLDVKCGMANLHTIMSSIHQHPLAYFDIETRELSCHFCHLRGAKYFFCCVKCDFNVHDHCFPSLPQTIKHDCHCDPLSLTKTRIADLVEEDEEQELYCSACEQRRNLADPSYSCKECCFVAHVHCVISEVLPHLQRDIEVLDDKDEASTSGDKADNAESLQELDAEIGALEEEIDEMAEELEQLYETRIQQVSTLSRMVRKKIRITGSNEGTSELLSYEKYLSRRFGHVF